MNAVLAGMVGGAAGSAALNVATYLDMALRGRPSSEVPAKVATKLGGLVGLDLDPETAPDQSEKEKRQSRRSAAGSLLGYVSGLGVGAAYGMLGHRAQGNTLAAGAVTGLAAMAASDLPSIATGATDVRKWGVAGWMSDLIPHLLYGVVTVATYERLR